MFSFHTPKFDALPGVDSVEYDSPTSYTLWGDNLDELLWSGNEPAYDRAKDDFASAVEGLRLPGVSEIEVYYEGKGRWSVELHQEGEQS